jgi:serine O-acetyltransferase
MPSYLEDARIRSFRELREYWREDIRINKGFWRPGSQALIMYRLGVWQLGLKRGVVRRFASGLYRVLHVFVRNRYGIELYASARIGRRLFIAHQNAIVLHREVVMGDDCLIRHCVTIGLTGQAPKGSTKVRLPPTIGDRVEIGVGAVIAGPITIGDDVKIGPNAVVMRSVPAGAMVTAPPARVLSRPPSGDSNRDANA